MPSKSKDQQRAAGMALAAKRGEMKASELQGAAKEMYDSMSEKDLEDFAKTKHDDLPEKVKESYDWIDCRDERMKRLNESLNMIVEAKLDVDKFIELLYKNVDLNEPDDFAAEMIIISADEFMKTRIDKKQAKEILKQFDKKYPRARK